MNIIEHLVKVVTPTILSGDADKSESSVLEQFYALFLAHISDEDNHKKLANGTDEEKSSALTNFITNKPENGQSLIEGLAVNHGLSEERVTELATSSSTKVLSEISSLAGDKSVSDYLKDLLKTDTHLIDLLPDWAAALLPVGLIGSGLAAAGALSDKAGDAISAVGSGIANVAGDAADAVTDVVDDVSDTVKSAHVNLTDSKEDATHSTKTNNNEESGGFLKALLPIIGLIVLGLIAWALLKGCQQEPVTTDEEQVVMEAEEGYDDSDGAEHAMVEEEEREYDDSDGAEHAMVEEVTAEDIAQLEAAEQLAPSSLSVSVDETGEKVYAVSGAAGNDDVKGMMNKAIENVFGGSALENSHIHLDANLAKDLPFADKMSDVLTLLKGVPNASIDIEGEDITLNAPDAAARDKLVADVQALLPSFNVEAAKTLDIETEVGNSLSAAETALDRLMDKSDVTADELVNALNLQIINFASDKDFVPDENKEILDKAVAIMEKLPEGQLSIVGHTDSQGADDYNQKLSESRANQVKAYLVEQGIDSARLQTLGAGETSPVADNSTEQGRFQNRRIEFAVVQ